MAEFLPVEKAVREASEACGSESTDQLQARLAYLQELHGHELASERQRTMLAKSMGYVSFELSMRQESAPDMAAYEFDSVVA